MKKLLFSLLVILPFFTKAQEPYTYESTIAKFKIVFPSKPFEKVGSNSTDIMWEDKVKNISYVASFRPSETKAMGEDLKNFVKSQASTEGNQEVQSVKLSSVNDKEAVKIASFSDLDFMKLYMKFYFVVHNDYQITLGIMTSEDKLKFEDLDEWTKGFELIE